MARERGRHHESDAAGRQRDRSRASDGRGRRRRRGASEPAEPFGIGYGPAFTGRRHTPARPRLSIDVIVEAAVDILDQDGGDALTFRRLAQDLGVGVASLYWHVDSKEILLDLALDRVIGEVKFAKDGHSADWLTDVRRTTVQLYRLLLAHRWAAAQMLRSRDRGPNLLTVWEHATGRLHAAGFSLQQCLDAVSLLINHVVAAAVQEAAWDTTGTLTVAQRRALRRERSEAMRSLDPQLFPTIVASADIFEQHDQMQQFEDGLDVILAGLEQRSPPAR